MPTHSLSRWTAPFWIHVKPQELADNNIQLKWSRSSRKKLANSYISHFLAGHNRAIDARRKQDRFVSRIRRVRFGDSICRFNLLHKFVRWKSHFYWAWNCEKVRARPCKSIRCSNETDILKNPNFTLNAYLYLLMSYLVLLHTTPGLLSKAEAAPLLGCLGEFAIWSTEYTDKSRRILFSFSSTVL